MNTRMAACVGLALMILAGCEGREGRGEMDIPAALAAQAEVTLDEARATALSPYTSGEVVSGELEEEGGALFYSFDVRVPGESGVEEIHVDAHSGRILSQEHETASDEAAENEA